MNLRRFRRIRRLAVLMAAIPVFQLAGACQTGFGQVAGNTLNLFPAIVYNSVQSTFLYPVQLGLALLLGVDLDSTGGTGGTGGSGGFGGDFGGTGSGLGGTGGGI
jgi:hypothetical protein